MKYNQVTKYKTIWELFQSSVRKFENNEIATYYKGLARRTYTYEDLYNNVKKFANFLHQNSLQKGDKAIVFVPTRGEWLDIIFASSLLGVILIPIDVESPIKMIEQIIEENNPKALFSSTQKEFPLAKKPEKVFLVEDFTKYIFDIDPITPRDFAKNIDPDDIFEIMYTSGTTGKPKGVIITYKNITTNLYNELLIFPIDMKYSALQILPFSHIFSQILSIGILCIGGKLTFPKKINAQEIKATLNESYINAIPSVPQFLTVLKDGIEAKFRKKHLIKALNLLQFISSKLPSRKLKKLTFLFIHKQLGGHIDTIASGGAPLDPKVFIWWENLGVRVVKGYGLTETGPIISFEDVDNRDPYSVGIPLPYQMIKIENDEILVKGDNVTQGYYKNDEKNKESFTKDGWYKTGDRGYMKDGKLYLNGRTKDMIVLSNGMNIYPQDIEFEFNRDPEILDSAVIGIDKGNGEELFAVVLTKKDRDYVQKLIKKINANLSINQWVRDFYIWHEEDFPRTHTKKVKRNEILEFLIKNNSEDSEIKQIETSEKVSPDKDNEGKVNKIKSIISQITKSDIQKISDDTNLFSDLNVDSLGRAEIVAEINSQLNSSLSESDIDSNTLFSDLIKKISSENLNIIHNLNESTPTWQLNPLINLYRNFFVYPILRIFLFFFVKIDVKKPFPKETQSPAVFIVNHRSNLDAICLFLKLPRKIRNKTIVAASGFHWDNFPRNIIRFILQIFIPIFTINGESTSNSFAKTAFYLNNGYNVVIFPEGKIYYEKKDYNNFQKGTAKILKEFLPTLIEVKIKGLEVVKKGSILPKLGRNPAEISFESAEVDYFADESTITKKLEKDFDGF